MNFISKKIIKKNTNDYYSLTNYLTLPSTAPSNKLVTFFLVVS